MEKINFGVYYILRLYDSRRVWVKIKKAENNKVITESEYAEEKSWEEECYYVKNDELQIAIPQITEHKEISEKEYKGMIDKIKLLSII